jgi:hypothetical protein
MVKCYENNLNHLEKCQPIVVLKDKSLILKLLASKLGLFYKLKSSDLKSDKNNLIF